MSIVLNKFPVPVPLSGGSTSKEYFVFMLRLFWLQSYTKKGKSAESKVKNQ
jgi:hypothetical protein